jgi:hypothetical protein
MIFGLPGISPATFNGQSSQITYNITLDNITVTALKEITLKVRTRQTSGIILDTTDGKFRLSFNNGNVRFEIKGPTGPTGTAQYVVTSNNVINDGGYHNVTVKIATSIELDVDSVVETKTGENYTVWIPNGYNGLSVGGIHGGSGFKGCLDDINVNGHNLPVFFASELVNDSSIQKFSAETITDIKIACVPDPVCATHDCKNNATCVDIWNAFTCKCVLGFDGNKCQNNIDDCPKSKCEKPGTLNCVDGINSFKCDCNFGYTGTW